MASVPDTKSKSAARSSMSPQPGAATAIDSFAMPFEPGQIIVGKYEVMELIGTGGVGFVVSARHIGFDELVALKFLRPEFATHPEAVTRFTLEARASFKIKSEHVARVLDVDTREDGTPFIAMELLEGIDLRTLLDRVRMLTIESAIDCALQTCEALAAAHVLEIVHRDIKPENLFLTGPGDGTDQLKVLDFGISKVALTKTNRQTHEALTRIAVGTPPYMSPEQVRASSGLDARSDLWSVGCVLYELLTGTAPFDRLSMMQSCAAVLEEEPVPPRDLRPTIPWELDAAVMRCLQKDPSGRFANVAELAEALSPFGSGHYDAYPSRCHALLRGEGLGRRSTPDGFAPIRRHSRGFEQVSATPDSLVANAQLPKLPSGVGSGASTGASAPVAGRIKSLTPVSSDAVRAAAIDMPTTGEALAALNKAKPRHKATYWALWTATAIAAALAAAYLPTRMTTLPRLLPPQPMAAANASQPREHQVTPLPLAAAHALMTSPAMALASAPEHSHDDGVTSAAPQVVDLPAATAIAPSAEVKSKPKPRTALSTSAARKAAAARRPLDEPDVGF